MNDTERRELEQKRRLELKAHKPLVYDKIIKFDEKFKKGESIAMIDFCYDYKCNLNCKHCCNSSFEKKDRSMTIEDVRNISEQADALGLAQVSISGGEPLTFDNLDEIILAFQPEKFHIALSTNALLLTPDRAKRLRELGVDKLKISVDSFDPAKHEANRNKKGVFNKVMDSLAIAKENGFTTSVITVLTKGMAGSKDLENMAKYCQENEFSMDIMLAKAIGSWEGKHELLADPEDTASIDELHKTYPIVFRDTMPSYGLDRGCGTVRNQLHITKYGDVLPCVFMHIAIGNIFEEPLKDIIDRGLSIKHFSEYNPLCLSGEDRNFIDKYMTKFYGKPLPLSYKEAFTEEDYIK